MGKTNLRRCICFLILGNTDNLEKKGTNTNGNINKGTTDNKETASNGNKGTGDKKEPTGKKDGGIKSGSNRGGIGEKN